MSSPPASAAGSVADEDPALATCDALMSRYGRHVNLHRRLAFLASLSIVLSTALIPVTIVVSTEVEPFLFGKLLPSLLAALAAGAAGAAQVVRPFDRWRIYEGARHMLAAERLAYEHGVADYAGEDASEIFLKRVLSVVRMTHEEWSVRVVPVDTAHALAEVQTSRETR